MRFFTENVIKTEGYFVLNMCTKLLKLRNPPDLTERLQIHFLGILSFNSSYNLQHKVEG